MRPLELTATARTSPRFMSGEYLKKSATESKGIFGTERFCGSWALTGTASNGRKIATAVTAIVSVTQKNRFISDLPGVRGRPAPRILLQFAVGRRCRRDRQVEERMQPIRLMSRLFRSCG